jgi:hypothetical protein
MFRSLIAKLLGFFAPSRRTAEPLEAGRVPVTFTWTGGSGPADLHGAANWVPGGPPEGGDEVWFTASSTVLSGDKAWFTVPSTLPSADEA